MGDKSSKGIMISSFSFFGDFTVFYVSGYFVVHDYPLITYFLFLHLDVLIRCGWGSLGEVFFLFFRLVFSHDCDALEV